MSLFEADAGRRRGRPPARCRRRSPSMMRVVRLGYRAEPRLLLASFAMTLLQALPDVLVALWLALITNGLVHHDHTRLLVGAFGLAASATLMWALQVTLDRTIRRLGDRLNIMFQGHVARLQAEVATVEHHERPVYLDRIAVLRTGVFALDHLFGSMFTMVGWLVRLAFVCVLLAAINPGCSCCSWSPRCRCSWSPCGGPRSRSGPRRPWRPTPASGRHVFPVATSTPPGKEIRVTGNQADLVARRRAAWGSGSRRSASPSWPRAAWLHAGLGGLLARVRRRGRLGRRPGSTPAPARWSSCSPPAAGSRRTSARRSASSASCAASGSTPPSAWPGSRTSPPSRTPTSTSTVPDRLEHGIRVRGRLVRLPRHDPRGARARRPDAARPAASSPSSARTAPGKSTLVKLLARMYAPTVGPDHRRRRRHRPHRRRRVARAAGRRLPGLRPPRVRRRDHRRARRRAAPRRPGRRGRRGRPGRRDDRGRRPARRPRHPARALVGRAASTSASASGRSSRSPAATCGPSRCCCMLDEPTAALDAETEHALFERFAAGAREADDERPGHGAGLPPLLDGADGRPDRGARRRPGRRGRQPRRADGAPAAPTPSCTPSRPSTTPDPRPEPRAPRARRFWS